MVAGGDAEHRGLAERGLRSGGVARANGPDVGREEERAAARFVGPEVIGERLELRRRRPPGRRRRPACRAGARAQAGTPDRTAMARERASSARAAVALGRGVLGDPHRERRPEARVVLGREPASPRSARRGPCRPSARRCGCGRCRRPRPRRASARRPRRRRRSGDRIERRARASSPRESSCPSSRRASAARIHASTMRAGSPDPARNAERVASRRRRRWPLRAAREALEGDRVQLGARAHFVASRRCRGARGRASRGATSPSRSPATRATAPRCTSARARVDLAAGGAHPRAVEQEQRAPRRVVRVASRARRAPLRGWPRRPFGPPAPRARARRSRARRPARPRRSVASRALVFASAGFDATSARYAARIRRARTFSSAPVAAVTRASTRRPRFRRLRRFSSSRTSPSSGSWKVESALYAAR